MICLCLTMHTGGEQHNDWYKFQPIPPYPRSPSRTVWPPVSSETGSLINTSVQVRLTVYPFGLPKGMGEFSGLASDWPELGLLRERWLASAGRRFYERYASSHQEKRDREDDIVWHSALRFLRSRRLKYTPSGIAQQGEH